MRNKLLLLLIFTIPVVAACQSEPRIDPRSLIDRERDGLIGDVRGTLTDDVVLDQQNGQWVETQQASSTTLYDASGKRTLQTPFRVVMENGFAITQHEALFDPTAKRDSNSIVNLDNNTKKFVEYDSKGNVIERGTHDNGKRIAAELSVKYEFDARGNWIKRTLLRPAQGAGQKELQPSEISYRQIIYADSAKATPATELIPVSAKQLKSPLPATEENLAIGKILFLQRCAACHGNDGKAKTDFSAIMPTKPADLTAKEIASLSDGEIYSAVSEGIKASGMPGYKGRIGDEAIWKIAMYTRQISAVQAKAELAAAKASPTPAKPATATDPERRYQLNGKIVSVEPELKQVTIEHQEIKGYMEAMTMPFPLRDEKLLNKVKKGDRIQATLVIGGEKGWRLENVVLK
ncbi:MAG TPA: copper-binding protein [Blastocatellia bacterium]|nr:copper-binding protein [Blastocatellia bacterium]